MKKTEDLAELAKKIRQDVLDMTSHAGANGGHIGGAYSSAEILAVLYGSVLNVSSDNPLDDNRDRFILSKGHVALGYYAALAETGFITREEMMTFEDSGSDFPTHTVMNTQKGIETSSGSLGYGLSIGIGIALAGKKKGKDYHVYVLMGDGECNEGSVWEGVIAASKFKLDNLTVIVDVNKGQLDGYTANVMPINNFEEVFKGFGWNVNSVDGHDIHCLENALRIRKKDTPVVVLANTIKGKGIKSIEGLEGFHHVRLTEEQYRIFCAELNA